MTYKSKLFENFNAHLLAYLIQLDNQSKDFLDANKTKKTSSNASKEATNLLQYYMPSRAPSLSSAIRVKFETVAREHYCITDTTISWNNHPAYMKWNNHNAYVKHATSLMEWHPELVAFFSVSHNGHIREEAVKKWGWISSPFEFALLLIRLNDWVSNVRKTAANKIKHILTLPANESGLTNKIIISCMDLIASPNRFSRASNFELEILTQLLFNSTIREDLYDYIAREVTDRSPRFLKLCIEQGLFLTDLEYFAINAQHPETRRFAFHVILNNKVFRKETSTLNSADYTITHDKVSLATLALSDKAIGVQRVVLDYILREKPKNLHTEKVYTRYLSSKYNSVVDRAITGLNQLGVGTMSKFREQVNQGALAIQHLAVFSRFGTQEDGELLYCKRHIFAEDWQLKLIGVSAKLKYKPALQDLEKLTINFSDNKEAKKAARLLHAVDGKLDFDEMYTVLMNGAKILDRGYLPFIRKLPTIQLARMIAALNNNTKYQDAALIQELYRKRNRGFFSPKNEETLLLQEELQNNTDMRKLIENILGLKLH